MKVYLVYESNGETNTSDYREDVSKVYLMRSKADKYVERFNQPKIKDPLTEEEFIQNEQLMDEWFGDYNLYNKIEKDFNHTRKAQKAWVVEMDVTHDKEELVKPDNHE